MCVVASTARCGPACRAEVGRCGALLPPLVCRVVFGAMSDQTAHFSIRTYGCQMNLHDSDKVANLLHHAGLASCRQEADADLLVINTCSIRDKAEQQLYSDLGRLRDWKSARAGRVLGVGGCVAQQVGDSILKRFPHVDFVFGTHNIRLVPAMVASAEAGRRSLDVAESRSSDRFDLPGPHPDLESDTPGRAFLTVMEGCDMFCSFCIVPRTRGREISRVADEVVAEARQLVDTGVREITLLGQTVNAYGRHDVRQGRIEATGTVPFAELLARLQDIPGLARLRYTSPHPAFFDAALIEAHGELSVLCPHVHLPLQSGSDSLLERMRRRYTRDDYLRIATGLQRARADLELTTDVIVGFPGESDADFRDTLSLFREVGFVDSYLFKYSPRPGTQAAEMGGAVEPQLAQQRLEELQALQRELTLAYHRSRIGTSCEILVEGPSRASRLGRGAGQICGRDPYHRVVNMLPPPGFRWAPGSLVPVDIVDATPHSLIAQPAGLPPLTDPPPIPDSAGVGSVGNSPQLLRILGT
jgi:tRNA-2-methylthio-N6-dimethylallyladenosine synthase